MRRFFLIAAAAMAAAAFSGPPEVPDLLIPLTEAEGIEVRQDNRSWLDQHLKHAKRHRLVRVDADVLLSGAMFRISFSGSRYLKDLAIGGSWPVPHDHYGDDCRCPAPEPVPGTAPFYAVRGNLSDPRYPAEYRLRPIERDPEYHVLIEIDPAGYRQSKVKL